MQLDNRLQSSLPLIILRKFPLLKYAVVPCYFLRTIDFSVYTWYTQVKKTYSVLSRDFLCFDPIKERYGKNMNTYQPQPIDTSDVVLSEDILALCEKLSENTHEVWSQTRINDGWTYGETRDDAKKHHPCLVPYDKLSESEKAYDRNTSMETLKLIIKLGYKITKE